MNAIVTGNGSGQNKEHANSGGNANAGNNSGSTKRKWKKCPHCGKTVFHKAADCYKLDANASKQWTGWKLVKETGEATS